MICVNFGIPNTYLFAFAEIYGNGKAGDEYFSAGFLPAGRQACLSGLAVKTLTPF